MNEIDELRLKEVSLTLEQQQIIEFAYAVRELVEPLAETSNKLSFELVNCYEHLFYTVRHLLDLVDPEYLKLHYRVVAFYREKRELSSNWDRLKWEKVRDDSRNA